jgi:hypothetical protein
MIKQTAFIMIAFSLLTIIAVTAQTLNSANAQESKVIPVCTGKGKTSTTPSNPATPVSEYSSLAGIWT